MTSSERVRRGAAELLANGRAAEAETMLQGLLAGSTLGGRERGFILVELAAALHRLNRLEEATAALVEARATGEPDVIRAAEFREARIELAKGHPQCIEHLTALVAESVDDEPGASALVTLAELHRAGGELHTAARLLGRAVHSRASVIADGAALLLSNEVADADVEAAIDGLRWAMESGPRAGRVRAAGHLGPLLGSAGRFEEAISVLSFATTGEDPQFAASAAVALGQVHQRLGNASLARAALQFAVELNAGKPSAIARRVLFVTGLAADGNGLGIGPDAAAVLDRRAAMPETDVAGRAALARKAAAVLDQVSDAPLAAALWGAGAQLDLERLPSEVRRQAIDDALRSAKEAVRMDEEIFGLAGPETAGSHFRLSQARAAARENDVDVDVDVDVRQAIADQERGIRAFAELLAAGAGGAQLLAVMKNNLATLYLGQVAEPSMADVQRAVELLEEAVEGHRAVLGPSHPLVFNTLGNLLGAHQKHQARGAGDSRRSLILTGEDALRRARAASVPPEHLLPILANLATLYIASDEGDFGANIGRAVDLAEQVREITDVRSGRLSEAAVRARLNLAAAYRWDPGPPLRAIEALEEALDIGRRVWPSSGAPLVAIVLDGLANSYALSASDGGGPPDAIERALECHTGAVEAARRWFGDADPVLADALLNHALTLRQIDDGARTREGIPLLLEAARIRDAAGGPFDRANVYAQLAVAYLECEPREFDPALEALDVALQVFTPATAPRNLLSLAAHFGQRLGEVGRWREAAHLFAVAQEAAATLQDSSVLLRSQADDAVVTAEAAAGGAYAQVRAGDPGDALMSLERFRAGWLRDALARDGLDLAELAEAAPEVAEAFEAASKALQAVRRHELETTDRITRPGPTLRNQSASLQSMSAEALETATAAQRSFQQALECVRQVDGFSDFLRMPTLEQLARTLAEKWAAAYVATTVWGTVTLTLLPTGEVEVISSSVTHDQLADLLGRTEGDKPQLVGGYLVGQLGDRIELDRAISATAALLGDAVLRPLAVWAGSHEVEGLVLMPGAGVAGLPLHALAYSPDGRCLLDDFDVVFAPSLRIMREIKRRSAIQAPRNPRFVGVASPRNELRFAGLETEAIAERFVDALVLSTEAEKDEILEAFRTATFLHLACHARYEPSELLDSYFQLARGRRLRLRDVLAAEAPLSARLAVASACQSAVTAWRPDEAMTLSGAFMHAGVSAVVGTLWSVNDWSTAVLMSRFYELVDTGDGGLAPWSALRAAQLWLRDATEEVLAGARRSLLVSVSSRASSDDTSTGMARFADRYHWAAFTCAGAP